MVHVEVVVTSVIADEENLEVLEDKGHFVGAVEVEVIQGVFWNRGNALFSHYVLVNFFELHNLLQSVAATQLFLQIEIDICVLLRALVLALIL